MNVHSFNSVYGACLFPGAILVLREKAVNKTDKVSAGKEKFLPWEKERPAAGKAMSCPPEDQQGGEAGGGEGEMGLQGPGGAWALTQLPGRLPRAPLVTAGGRAGL